LTRRRWASSLICCSALLLAGCGSQAAKPCQTPAELKALTKLNGDLVLLRRAAARGNVDKETDTFLLDVATAPVDNLVRNRMIDHAAAIVSPVCQQCFQALEAARPIPGIAHAHEGQACHAPS
jgi:hypothetical protein